MSLLGNDSITVHRRQPGSWGGDGTYQDGATSTFTIDDANVQPLGGREAQTLPEGLRQRTGKVIYTDTELRAVDPQADQPGDRLDYEGETYEVRKVEEHDGLLSHYKVTAVRTKE